MVLSQDFLLWSVYCCPPLDGEEYEAWQARAWAEYCQTFPPDDHPLWKGHGGYGLKPEPVVM